ncbi:unnamed protein product [Closterium sp. Naga37s-1]|nr:unnamed protein product [Closterium sp. Naga37s-1]
MAGKAAAPQGLPDGIDKDEIYEMAAQQMEYRVSLFNSMVATCFDKCYEKKYKESELNLGETSCVDRCVSKYWQVRGIIGQYLGVSGSGM